MKRIFSFIAACATMFALAACQEELQQPVEEQKPVLEGIEGEFQEVTFSVNLEDKAQTKAISDGLSATNLQYAVYRSEEYVASDGTKYPAGQYIPALSQGDNPKAEFSNAKIETSGDRTWKVTLTLAKNVKYDIVFWAYADDAPYTFKEDEGKIFVDNYTTEANAEIRDAFYGLCKGYSVISSDERVELRRPFAQINFGACDYIPYVTDLGLEVTSTIDTQAHEAVDAVYDSNGRLLYPERPAVAKCTVPNTLNVLDGTVSGAAPVDFLLADIPYNGDDKDKVLLKAKTADGEVIYHWMGMNYILAGPESTINNIHATFHYNGQDLVFDVPNVPYKRNYKTNIIGNLFTENAKFNVVVVPQYADPDIVIDLDELEALNPIERAIKLAVDGKLTEASVVLSADLELDETITVPAGLNLVLDLGGKTLTSSVAPAFLANGSVTMSNGNAQVAGEFVRAGAGAKITLTGVKAVSGTETAAGDNCVFVPKDATDAKVVIGKDTELKSYGAAAIQSNGHTEGLVLTVAGKVESVGVVAMYLPQVSSCTIEDKAVISGATGIELRAGNLVVKDGASISAGDDFKAEANGNGSTVLGAAVAVSAHSTNLPINVTIEGGVFSCEYALYEVNFFEDRTAETKLSVKAGTFNAPILSKSCTGFITGGTFAENVEVPADYLAEGLIVGEDGVVKEKPAITVTAIKDVIPGDKEYTVEGVVVAVGVNGYVVADDAAIFVYGQNHGRKLNEKVQLTGVVSQKYKNNVMQFSSPAVTVLEETATYTYSPKSVDGSAIDAAVASGTATCEEVTFMGILSVSGEYVNITIDGGTKQGSLKYITASDYASLASKKVVVKGYVTSTHNYYSVLPYSVELAPKEYTDWYLMGINDDWGTGIQMEKYDNGDDYGVIYNLEVAANQNFKFKNAGDWFGYWDVLTPSTEYVAGVDGGNAMFISAGTYDVYFATDKSHYVVLPVGSALPSNPYELGWTWRIVGTNNGWQANETATPFVASGDVLVAKAVVFADAVSFKILERTHDWNYSLCINGNQPIIDGKPANLKVNGDNIVPTTNGSTGLPAGTYDLYLDPLARTLSIKSYVEAPAETNEVLSFIDWKFDGAKSWNSSYTKRTVTFTSAVVEFASANKQSGTITHCPVTKGGDVVVKMSEGKKLTSAKFNLLQWTTKTQTATLYYSTDNGTTWSSESIAKSSNFILESSLPEGTNALKLKFSSTSNQVAIESIEISYTE